MVLPRAAGWGRTAVWWAGFLGAVLQGAVAHQPAAPWRQSRTGPLLRELTATSAGMDLRRELHPIVAGPAPRLPYAGALGHAHWKMGTHYRPLRPRHRIGTRLSQGDERQAERRSSVRSSSGDAAAGVDSRWPLRRGAGRSGRGTRLRLQTVATVVSDAPRRARLDR